MYKTSSEQLKHAVESQHGGAATLVQSVPVHEQRGSRTVWSGEVTVFDLKGCPTGAFRAYAWPMEHPDGTPRIIIVLHTPVIVGPQQAVRAALAMEATR
jgi:hypothetical protein